MFERFTQEARDTTTAAVAIARESGGRSVESRHLLLALIEKKGPAADALRRVGVAPGDLARSLRTELRSGGLDAEALASIGIDLDAVRERADAVFGEGALDRAGRSPVHGHLPFAAETKKILELALREAIRLHTNRIDGSMLVLGVLRADDSAAASSLRRALDEAGSSVGALRTVIEETQAKAS